MLKRTPRSRLLFLSRSPWSPDGRRRRRRHAVLWIGTGAVFAVALLLLSGRRDAAVSGVNPPPAPAAARIMDFSVGTYAHGPDAATGSSAIPRGVPAVQTPSSVPTSTPMPAPVPTPAPTPAPPDLDELTGFYMADAERYYSGCGYSSNRYEYTGQELYMLAQLISGEARGESSRGKIAVGNVVMNRVLSPGYPGDTIPEVILAPGQFTGYSSSITPGAACMAAARQVLEKEVWVIPQDVYFFHAGAGRHWGGHTYYARIGGHCFYRESYGGRSRNKDVPPALFERTFKWPQYGCKPGKRVSRLQTMLAKLGYSVKADGYFGKTTEEALILFQASKGLRADGIAGPSTVKALVRAYGVERYAAKYL